MMTDEPKVQLTERDAHYELLNALEAFTGTGGEEFVDVEPDGVGVIQATLKGPTSDLGTVRVRIRIEEIPPVG